MKRPVGTIGSRAAAGQGQKERQAQADFYEIGNAIDIPGSVALNARQPSPAGAAGSTAAQAPIAPDKIPVQASAPSKNSSSVSRTEGSSSKETQVAPVSAGKEVELNRRGETGADQSSSAADPGAQGSSKEGEDGKSVQHAGGSPSAAPSAPCEVATLQQLLRTKIGNLALVSDVDEQLLLNISFKQPVRVKQSPAWPS